MPHPKVKIADNSGNEVGVTNNKLDVNATISAGDLNIGNVDVHCGNLCDKPYLFL